MEEYDEISNNNKQLSDNKKYRKINLDMLLSSVSLTKYTRESDDNYFKRVTHLHLQNKRIRKIKGLEVCANLKVLYLYDNFIDRIENLDFATKLEQLYLQNNKIKEIPDIKLENLTKIHLEDNEISYVAGLDICKQLKELYINNQRLNYSITLEFDYNLLNILSNSLIILDISNNNINKLNPFNILKLLQKLIVNNNNINDINEVEILLSTLYHLNEFSIINNPVCHEQRYYDRLLNASNSSLELLDGKPIHSHQQIAIKGLVKHRQQLFLP